LIMSLIESPGIVDERSGLLAMTEFSAHRPFVGRALVPLLVLLVERACPESILGKADGVMDGVIRSQGARIFGSRHQDKFETAARAGRRVAIFELLNWLCLTGFLWVLSSLLVEVAGLSSRAAAILPLTLIFVFPAYFDFANHVYDFAALFLFCLALLLLYRRNWIGYSIVFAAALLNKETAMLLTLVFVLYYHDKIARPEFYRLLSVQLFLVAAFRIAAMVVFSGHSGSFLEWHLPENITYLSRIGNYFRFEPLGPSPLFPDGLAIPYPKGLNLPVLLTIGFLVFAGWKKRSLFLRSAVLILPILYALCLLFGIISELRSYYEELPILFLMVASRGGKHS